MNFIICNAIFLFKRVEVGSVQHILPIVLASAFCLFVIIYSKNKLTKSIQEKYFLFFSVFISTTVFIYHIWEIGVGSYNFNTDLPLYLCSLMALVIPVFGYYRTFWMYEILLFWIIVGTSQGIITPDIEIGFPSFDYFRYWIVHLGLLVVVLYATFVFKMKPKLKSVFKSFFALQIYVVFAIIMNYILDANYGYLNQKPNSASILDYFGEWPYYIIVVQLALIPVFLLIYFLFYLADRK